jgi:DNA-binding XRE family transcriptional regulator
MELHRKDQLKQKMADAVKALERVVQHLKLKDQKAQLALTMREFDAAPEKVRQGWTGRQVADAIRGSWELAKAVAFTDEYVPSIAEYHWLRNKGLTRKRREAKFTLGSLQKWLATKPESKSLAAYERWAVAQNKKLREGQKPYPQRTSVWRRWQLPWTEIVEAVEENRVPGEPEPVEQEAGGEGKTIWQEPNREVRAVPELDTRLLSQRLREARKRQGWTLKEVGEQIGLDESTIGHIENHRVKNPMLETIAKLAAFLGLSLDALIANDSAEASSAEQDG